eukprot:TRINITY_DN28231_c0_g1_i1.p1 TRINITY_DN28231_c0_g1~~TRINITY_DN28231_c0_g1_i1.p1  ORF type:complete len:141 (+),score=54.00 TRINITY_DN28231_c0_g1_i1:32-454(+)
MVLVYFVNWAIVGGMVLVYFVNWAIASQGDEAWVLSTGWRYMLASGAIPAALFLLLLLLVPETPRWLVMKGRNSAARRVLDRLGENTESSIAEIEASLVVRHEKLFAFGGLVIFVGITLSQIGRAVQQECRDRSRMPSSA